MQVLILEDDPAFQAQLALAMMGKGFNVLCVETVPAAEAFLRLDMADVLIAGERIGGRLSHPVALLAECRNPLVAAVLLTERTGPDLDELFDLMPSLVAVLGRRVAPSVVTQVVMAAVADMASDTVRGRLAARWVAADRPEGVAADDPIPAARSHAGDETPRGGVPERDGDISGALGQDVVPSGPVPQPQTEARTAHGWDRLWQAEIAPLVAPLSAEQPQPAPDSTDIGAGYLPTCPAVPADAMGAQTVASPPAASAPVTASGRSLRPSADSPLARVMAAGNRAVSRGLRPSESAAPQSRGTTSAGWLAATPFGSRTLIRAEGGAPAVPAPSLPPHAMPLPATLPARRLHLT